MKGRTYAQYMLNLSIIIPPIKWLYIFFISELLLPGIGSFLMHVQGSISGPCNMTNLKKGVSCSDTGYSRSNRSASTTINYLHWHYLHMEYTLKDHKTLFVMCLWPLPLDLLCHYHKQKFIGHIWFYCCSNISTGE